MIDVCLLLEGTYPYVAGGVSTWVHQLISSMRDIRFSIVTIAPHADPTRKPKYQVPQHVVAMKEIYLHEYGLEPTRFREPKAEDYRALKDFYEDLSRHRYERFDEILALFMGENRCFDLPLFFSSPEIWKGLQDFYHRYAHDVSFIDFFWTWRGTHLPLLQILQTEIPRARIYHAVSTGYAGLLGAAAKVLYGEKFFLTEHGIYTHERKLEIAQAGWIYEQEARNFRAERDMPFFKKWWIEMFHVMSGLAYQRADHIYTLYEGNRLKEVLEGADPEKITIIPNGIDIHSFRGIVRESREKRGKFQVGLIGRVVPIKDVKTFILAAREIHDQMPEVEFFVVGPTDEEPEYYEECCELVDTLGLESVIKFTGRKDVKEVYRFLDLVLLTSVSEAQPYVILEANICGIPVVATDVGACREMLEGVQPEDRVLGASGLLTPVGNYHETARAVIRLLKDAQLYEQMKEAGIERVQRYYDQDDLLSRYLNIYEQNR